MIGGKVINDVFYENVSFRNYGCLVGMAVVSLEWQYTVLCMAGLIFRSDPFAAAKFRGRRNFERGEISREYGIV